ncbi:hypothetical protein FDENT_888 [Fusarium denticulatum]|uniref:Uncharacterized protein n=1 Tax=Fusarium denticulatum TaxID=48507 RepID=A0A8H5XJ54_9HYPO|nr:hypothetical protein FDENT_888 [Fusarium denticulatum]
MQVGRESGKGSGQHAGPGAVVDPGPAFLGVPEWEATQANILLEVEKVNGFWEGISQLLAVNDTHLEILAAVRALKPSADDQHASVILILNVVKALKWACV